MASPATPTTYALLLNQIEDHLNRSDVDTEGVSALMVSMFEDEANDRVKHHERRIRSTASLTSQYLDLPDDWMYPLTVRLITSGHITPLDFVTPQNMQDYRADAGEAVGRPRFITTSDDALEVVPTPDDTYTIEMHYWGTIPALSASNTTNWLLDRHPLLYLYGSLLHAEAYFQNDARVLLWERFVEKKYAAMDKTYDESFGQTRTRIRAIG